MAYLGAYRQGDWITFRVLCTDTSDTPREPDNLPRVRVQDGAGNILVANVAMPFADANGGVGLCMRRWQLTVPATVTGNSRYCSVFYSWRVGGNPRARTDTFELVPGGDAQGNHLSMFYWDRPGQKLLVQHLDSGLVVRSRNPYL